MEEYLNCCIGKKLNIINNGEKDKKINEKIPDCVLYEYFLGKPVWEKLITWNDLKNISVCELNDLHFNINVRDFFRVKYG